MSEQKLFRSSNEFSLHIESLAINNRISHMDAVLKYCHDNLLEPEEIASKINKALKEKIAVNMRELNYLPKQASLDL